MALSASQEPDAPGYQNGFDQHGDTTGAPAAPQASGAPDRRGASSSVPSGRWCAGVSWFRLHRRRRAGEEPAQSLAVFRTQVEQALALLAFGITEGRRSNNGGPQLTPEIIEPILRAEDLLFQQEPPSWQQRADFTKAYCLLTQALTPVTASLLTMPRWQQSTWFWGVMAGVFLGFAVLWAGLLRSSSFVGTPAITEGAFFTQGTFAIVALGALLSTTLVGFLWRFAYWFTGIVTRQKLNQIISFCYAFTLLAIASPLLMIGVVLMFPYDLYRILAIDSPIAITLGCSVPLGGEEPNAVPKELRCGSEGNESYQWVVNVGGTPTQQFWPKDGNAQEFWRRPRLHIQGGVVIPVYIIVLAFIGGAVSMTRRVPEYQRRVADPTDPMTPEYAREACVFQIMQVISAPLIAITLYHLVAPGSRAASIALGFAAGFASEPILVGIRALVEKMIPASPAPLNK